MLDPPTARAAAPAPPAPAPPPAPAAPPAPRPGLRRPTQGRIMAGVAAGLAEHLGLPVRAIRIAFVVGSIVSGGAGVVAYVLLWALTPQETTDLTTVKRPGRVAAGSAAYPAPYLSPDRAGSGGRSVGGIGGVGGVSGVSGVSRERLTSLIGGVVMVVVAAAVLVSRAGLDLHAEIWLPIVVLLLGAGIGLRQLDISERARWLTPAGGSQRIGVLRLAAGLVLAVVGILLLAIRGASASDFVPIVIASLAVLLGVGLVLAPWALRLWRDLERERALRVREVERAEIAAHLHDSVLQTLALIQRKPGDAAEVVRLARAQERELRDWLYAGTAAGADHLQVAVREVVAEVEDAHGVPVELVVVGDRPVDEASRALVQALREALLNAVRHGRPPVAAYVESGPEGVSAFVRDRGAGFEPDDVPSDRLGVRESIIGRMQRHGGRAEVRRVPAGGTEVRLDLPGPQSPAETPAQNPAEPQVETSRGAGEPHARGVGR